MRQSISRLFNRSLSIRQQTRQKPLGYLSRLNVITSRIILQAIDGLVHTCHPFSAPLFRHRARLRFYPYHQLISRLNSLAGQEGRYSYSDPSDGV